MRPAMCTASSLRAGIASTSVGTRMNGSTSRMSISIAIRRMARAELGLAPRRTLLRTVCLNSASSTRVGPI
jgi:hypothetical protein